MFSFNDNRKTVNEIFTMFDEGKLIVDDTYQRRSVWSEKDKVRLIETILLQLVIPELFSGKQIQTQKQACRLPISLMGSKG